MFSRAASQRASLLSFTNGRLVAIHETAKGPFDAPDWLRARCLIAVDPSSARFFLPGFFNQITACCLQRPVCVQVVVEC